MKYLLLTSALAISVSAAAANAQDWAVEGYGGVRLANTLDYSSSAFDLDRGTMYGLAIYRKNLLPDWEFGLDYSQSQADYTGYLSGLDTKALMVVARYNFPTTGVMGFYASAGVGAIRATYDGSTQFPAFTGSDTVTGAQISLGAQYPVGGATVFAELRHQRALDDPIAQGLAFEYQSSNVLLGLRFEF